SAAMAAALTLLGVVEPHRRPMATALLSGTVLVAGGRTLGTSATLSGAVAVADVSRFAIAAGLFLLTLAVLLDAGPGEAPANTARSRSIDVGQMLPHVALLLAVIAAGWAALTEQGLNVGTVLLAVVCVFLAGVHRWQTAVEEHRMRS